MDRILFSSQTDMWATPQDLFDELNEEFHFDLDPCATYENAKCDMQNFLYLCKVKKKHADIDRMVMESHYLESLERESSPALSDMERQDYIDQINDLKASNRRLIDMIDTLKQTLESVTASNKRNEELVVKLTAQIDQLQKMVKNLEDKNQRHNKHTFGKSSLKKNKRAEDKKSREEEKEDYDGNHDNRAQASENTDNKIDQTKVKSEHLDGERAKRENYTKMNAAKVTELLCDTSNIPAGMRFIGFKEINEYDKISYIECVSYQVAILEDEFGVRHEYFVPADAEKAAGRRPHLNTMPGTHGTPEFIADLAADIYQLHTPNIEHCLCWAHVRAKFQYALEISKEEDAEWYRNQIDYLYLVESEIFTNDQVTPEIIKERREGKDVTDTLTALYSHARKALRQKGKKYSDLMVQALNYMLNSWDELQTYRKDGRYTIDNLPAERAIRPFTVSRKNSLHYSSEEGVEMAMTYLTIIETAKMWGLQVQEYLTYVWREVMSGNTDYESMTPEVVIAKQNS